MGSTTCYSAAKMKALAATQLETDIPLHTRYVRVQQVAFLLQNGRPGVVIDRTAASHWKQRLDTALERALADCEGDVAIGKSQRPY